MTPNATNRNAVPTLPPQHCETHPVSFAGAWHRPAKLPPLPHWDPVRPRTGRLVVNRSRACVKLAN